MHCELSGGARYTLAPFLTGKFAEWNSDIKAWVSCELSGGKPTFPTGKLKFEL